MTGIFKKYLQDTSGNIAMIFGVGSIMLFLATGVGLDVSGMTRQSAENQQLADMAVLAAASSRKQTQAELQEIAEDMVTENGQSSVQYTTTLKIISGNKIQVEVAAPYDMKLMHIFGYGKTDIVSVAEAPPRGDGKLNLAMVLDVTGSMSGSKLTALKSAANELVDTFEVTGVAASGNVMMSVVPFAHYVKIPDTNLGQPWLEVEPPTEFTWTYDENNCEGDDGVANDVDCTPSMVSTTQTLSWKGCMGSRHTPYNSTPDFNGMRLQGFAGRGSCHSDLLPLTTNISQVKSAIAGLTAKDETHIPAGLMWGWRTLSPNAPFTEANTPDKNERRKALLLMTDGESTYSYGGESDTFNGVYNWEEDQPAADAMTAKMCTDIKATGITIYTIAFEVSDTATQNLLRTCASDVGKYYDAGNAAQLETAFGTIGDELAEVRLSR